MMPDTAARLECHELIYRATFHLDKQQWPEYAACFAPDGVLIRPSDGARLEGPAAIVESHSGRAPSTVVHIVSNTFFFDVTPTSMTAQSRVMKFAGPADDENAAAEPVIVIGNYTDKLTLVGDRWLISQRSGDRELMARWPTAS